MKSLIALSGMRKYKTFVINKKLKRLIVLSGPKFSIWAKSDLIFNESQLGAYFIKRMPTLFKMESLAKYALSFGLVSIKDAFV